MKYADAGVDIAVADAAKQRIRHHASRTFTPGVLGGIGGFGALFALDRKKWKEPVLVSSADGVGTKLKVAMATGVHSTVAEIWSTIASTTFWCRARSRYFFWIIWLWASSIPMWSNSLSKA